MRECYALDMDQEKRGMRFPFSTDAEVFLEGSPKGIPARVTELSFRGCFLEISTVLKEHQHVMVKIFQSESFFEALAEVIYLRPTGAGLLFGDVKPHIRNVLQEWILASLDNQVKSERSQKPPQRGQDK